VTAGTRCFITHAGFAHVGGLTILRFTSRGRTGFTLAHYGSHCSPKTRLQRIPYGMPLLAGYMWAGRYMVGPFLQERSGLS